MQSNYILFCCYALVVDDEFACMVCIYMKRNSQYYFNLQQKKKKKKKTEKRKQKKKPEQRFFFYTWRNAKMCSKIGTIISNLSIKLSCWLGNTTFFHSVQRIKCGWTPLRNFMFSAFFFFVFVFRLSLFAFFVFIVWFGSVRFCLFCFL